MRAKKIAGGPVVVRLHELFPRSHVRPELFGAVDDNLGRVLDVRNRTEAAAVGAANRFDHRINSLAEERRPSSVQPAVDKGKFGKRDADGGRDSSDRPLQVDPVQHVEETQTNRRPTEVCLYFSNKMVKKKHCHFLQNHAYARSRIASLRPRGVSSRSAQFVHSYLRSRVRVTRLRPPWQLHGNAYLAL